MGNSTSRESSTKTSQRNLADNDECLGESGMNPFDFDPDLTAITMEEIKNNEIQRLRRENQKLKQQVKDLQEKLRKSKSF